MNFILTFILEIIFLILVVPYLIYVFAKAVKLYRKYELHRQKSTFKQVWKRFYLLFIGIIFSDITKYFLKSFFPKKQINAHRF
ncbi:MAG: hypothetical protein RLZZ306_2625 [Bacteroidota bacterium]|jgi:CDP-diglyceride synthetase